MRATYTKKKHTFFIWACLIAVLCCLVTNVCYDRGVSSVASGALSLLLTPVRSLSAAVYRFAEQKTVYLRDLEDLQAQNDALRQENLSLQRLVGELAPLREENERLYAFLDLKRENTSLSLVNASVIARSSSNYTSDFTIDKGSFNGIEKDMAVIAQDTSLLGIIVEVGANYARGKTLTSYDLSLGVRNERTGEPAIVTGGLALSRQNKCCIERADPEKFAVGDVVRTSGLGDLYPAGLYVGEVSEYVTDELDHEVRAVVVPSGSIFDSDFVMVVTGFQRQPG